MPLSYGSFPETGERLVFERAVTYTSESKASTKSFRLQMAVLRSAAEQWNEIANQQGMSSQGYSLSCGVIGDGHLRLADALDKLQAALPSQSNLVATESTTTSIDDLFLALDQEHAPVLDQLAAQNGPPSEVQIG